MTRAHVTARIEQADYDLLVRLTDSGQFSSLSQAIAHFIHIGLISELDAPLTEDTLRRILREELAQVSIQQQPVGGQPANPKLGKLLSKTVR